MNIIVAMTDVHVCTLHTLDLGTVQSNLLSEHLEGYTKSVLLIRGMYLL